MHTTYDAIDQALQFVPAAIVFALIATALWFVIKTFPQVDEWMIAKFDRLCGVDQEDATEIPPFVTRAFHPLNK